MGGCYRELTVETIALKWIVDYANVCEAALLQHFPPSCFLRGRL